MLMLETWMQILTHVFMAVYFVSMIWFAVGWRWRHRLKRRTVFITQFAIEVFLVVCLSVLLVGGYPVLDGYVFVWVVRLPLVFVLGRSYVLATKRR